MRNRRNQAAKPSGSGSAGRGCTRPDLRGDLHARVSGGSGAKFELAYRLGLGDRLGLVADQPASRFILEPSCRSPARGKLPQPNASLAGKRPYGAAGTRAWVTSWNASLAGNRPPHGAGGRGGVAAPCNKASSVVLRGITGVYPAPRCRRRAYSAHAFPSPPGVQTHNYLTSPAARPAAAPLPPPFPGLHTLRTHHCAFN